MFSNHIHSISISQISGISDSDHFHSCSFKHVKNYSSKQKVWTVLFHSFINQILLDGISITTSQWSNLRSSIYFQKIICFLNNSCSLSTTSYNFTTGSYDFTSIYSGFFFFFWFFGGFFGCYLGILMPVKNNF